MKYLETSGVATAVVAALALLAVLTSGGPAAAQEAFGNARTCLDERLAANQPIAECVTEVQVVCLSFDAPSFSGAECYRRAKEHWGELIAARMDKIRAEASEELSAIAGIEVKYDLKSNLLQCDRMEELALVQRDPDQETLYARLRCEATAVGLAYAKLYYQSSGID